MVLSTARARVWEKVKTLKTMKTMKTLKTTVFEQNIWQLLCRDNGLIMYLGGANLEEDKHQIVFHFKKVSF